MAIVFGPTKWQNDYFISYPIQSASLGDPLAGGYLICRNGGIAWIVAPASTEVSRCWDCRDDAVTTAQASAACGDWFVPSCTQLKNPGYACRTYWDSYSSTNYWSSTGHSIYNSQFVSLSSGGGSIESRAVTFCVRSFRCVAY